jgi:hypothetical protein
MTKKEAQLIGDLASIIVMHCYSDPVVIKKLAQAIADYCAQVAGEG